MNTSQKFLILYFIIKILSSNAATLPDSSYYDDISSSIEDDILPQPKLLIPFFNATAFWQSKHLWKYPQTTTQPTTQSTTTTPATTSSTTAATTSSTTAAPTSSTTAAPTSSTTAAPTSSTTSAPITRLVGPDSSILGFAALPQDYDYADPNELSDTVIESGLNSTDDNVVVNRRRRPNRRQRPAYTPIIIYRQPPPVRNVNPWSYIQPNFWG